VEKGRKFNLSMLTRTALLLALTLTVQSLRLPTFITGPLVNMMLILTTIIVGTAGGVFVGLFTPWIALLVGILPAPLAPAVPFIMLGNASYCFLFGRLGGSGWRKVIAVIIASLFKFFVIGGSVQYLLKLPAPMSQALLFPQLITALIGGCLAISIGYSLQGLLKKG
jgi:hypothetical protein